MHEPVARILVLLQELNEVAYGWCGDLSVSPRGRDFGYFDHVGKEHLKIRYGVGKIHGVVNISNYRLICIDHGSYSSCEMVRTISTQDSYYFPTITDGEACR